MMKLTIPLVIILAMMLQAQSNEGPGHNQSFLARSGQQKQFSASLLIKKSSNPSFQDSVNPFQGGSVSEFKRAGDALQLSMWLKYGSNFASYFSYLAGSEGGQVLSIGSTGASIFSDYKVGQAGSFLYAYGNTVSPDYGFKLSEAGNHLRSYRTMSFISSGLGLVSYFLLVSAASDLGGADNIDNVSDEELNDALSKIISAGVVGLSGFIVKIFAVNHVGNAGDKVESFSNDIQTEWQKHYFAECGTNLKEYNKRWDRGWGLIIAGLTVAVGGAVAGNAADESAVTIAGASAGGLMALVGVIYLDWLAPASMGSSGSNLRDFEARMRNAQR